MYESSLRHPVCAPEINVKSCNSADPDPTHQIKKEIRFWFQCPLKGIKGALRAMGYKGLKSLKCTFLEVLGEEVWGEGAANEVAREAQGPHQVDRGGRRPKVVRQVGLHWAWIGITSVF